MRGIAIRKRLMSFAFEKTPRLRLGCKLISVHYRENKRYIRSCYHAPVFPWAFGAVSKRFHRVLREVNTERY